MSSLSLYDIAMACWPKVKMPGASVHDWLSYVNANRDNVRVIVKAGKLDGMIIASKVDNNLHVKEIFAFAPDTLAEFASRLKEIFGEFDKVSFIRRGRPKTVELDKFLKHKHI